jgi:hypothetical protein
MAQQYDTRPVIPAPPPNAPPRRGESQLAASRRILAESLGPGAALAAINVANPAIDKQTRR